MLKTQVRRFTLLFTLTLAGCGSAHDEHLLSNSGALREPVNLDFAGATTIFERNRCLNCHTAEKGDAGGINLETLDNVRGRLPVIISTVESGFMPLGPGARVSPADIQALKDWAALGAPEFRINEEEKMPENISGEDQ